MPVKNNPTSPRELVPGFAKIVKKARLEKEWSQRQLAAEAGVSAMCVCDVEAENRSPSFAIAIRIAKALGLKMVLDGTMSLLPADEEASGSK